MLLLFLSLLAGVLTVFAPCTIALLPVIVGGAVAGEANLKRLFVVTGSLGVSVIAFTLLLKVSSGLVNIPESLWLWLSGGIITALGFSMLFPTAWERIPLVGLLNRGSNRLVGLGYLKQSFLGDIIIGASLGPVFSSCSPTFFLIIATVLPRSLAEGSIYLLAYTLGLCGTLFIVALGSQKVLTSLGFAIDPNGIFRKVIGLIFIVIGLLIAFGYEKKLELVVADRVYDVTKIERYFSDRGTQKSAISTASSTPTINDSNIRIRAKESLYTRAPEITDPSGFVNTDSNSVSLPLTLAQFRGKKVVLIDFWTYSCINCQRTLPYLKAWDDKYRDQGLQIIGIHTPEFGFEKVQSNVERAVKEFGLKYPSVMDNNYGTWKAFDNSYWPRKYLIDLDGFIVYDHAGEGNYDATEDAIKKALKERADILGTGMNVEGHVSPVGAIDAGTIKVGSPETYFGSARNEYLANGKVGRSGSQSLVLSTASPLNTLNLGGDWSFASEFAESTSPHAKVIYKYRAKDVYFVASSLLGAKLLIRIDGKTVDAASGFAGADVSADGNVNIKDERLYHLIHAGDSGEHTLEIEVIGGSLRAYTFTFG